MKQKGILYVLITFLISFKAFAQTEPEISIVFLENDNIVEVNINQDNFIKQIGKVTDILNEEYSDINESQKIAILIVLHNEGNPTIELYSNPKISIDDESQILEKLKSQNIENTILVDFPILILINSKFEEYKNDFNELHTTVEKRYKEYDKADLKRKYELNIEYSVEVLSVLSAYQVIVDDQFAGVKNFGKLVSGRNFNQKQNITELTSKNSNYWRAVMEMNIGNQLIPITKIFMLVSQGEFDYAMKYIEILSVFSDPKSIPDKYLNNLAERLDMFNIQLNTRIQEGIAYHDRGEYSKAIAIYKEILKVYPNSAWAKYEVYFSQNTHSLENKEIELGDRTEWDNAKTGIYKSNPLYSMDVRASNGEEGYLLFRRASISKLFKDNKNILNDIYEYADIALDIKVYDFAAHLFWISFIFDKTENDALYKFLFCIEKLGVTHLKDNFKGDFEKEFKKIEKNKEKEMKESNIYKSFKN